MFGWLIITFWRNVLDRFQHKQDFKWGWLIGWCVGWFLVLLGMACLTFLASTYLGNGQIIFLMWEGERGPSYSSLSSVEMKVSTCKQKVCTTTWTEIEPSKWVIPYATPCNIRKCGESEGCSLNLQINRDLAIGHSGNTARGVA